MQALVGSGRMEVMKKASVVPSHGKPRDPDFVNAEVAMKRAALKAREKARQAGINITVFENGRVVEKKP
jgi:hypothetical protein